MNQLVYILGDVHMTPGLTALRRGKLNTPLKQIILHMVNLHITIFNIGGSRSICSSTHIHMRSVGSLLLSTHLRGSAHSVFLSVNLPTHLYDQKMWCNSFQTKLFLFSPDGNCFVSRSTAFLWVLT